MAITKIHAIQATVHKAVNYICNSQKQMKVVSFLPSDAVLKPLPLTSNLLCQNKSGRPQQSLSSDTGFRPGEVSYKEAHRSVWSLPTSC